MLQLNVLADVAKLVLQRVVNFRFRAGSGYCNPGSGPGTGIPLNLKPGYPGTLRVTD